MIKLNSNLGNNLELFSYYSSKLWLDVNIIPEKFTLERLPVLQRLVYAFPKYQIIFLMLSCSIGIFNGSTVSLRNLIFLLHKPPSKVFNASAGFECF